MDATLRLPTSDRSPGRMAGLIALATALAVAGEAAGCDPNHDWGSVRHLTRKDLAPEAAAALATRVFETLPAEHRPAPGQVVELTWLEDLAGRTGWIDAGGERTRDQDASERRLLLGRAREGLGRGLERRWGASLVDPPSGGAGEGPPGSAGADSTDQETGRPDPAFLLRVRLVDYGDFCHVMADRYEANRGLHAYRRRSWVRARVSVHAPTGEYLFIDEVEAQAWEGAVYWAGGDPARPIQIVEYKRERPGREARWLHPPSGSTHVGF